MKHLFVLFVFVVFSGAGAGCGLFGGDSEEKDGYEIRVSPNLSSAPSTSREPSDDDAEPSEADTEFDTQLKAAISLAKQGNLGLAKTLASEIKASSDPEREARRQAFIRELDSAFAEQQNRATARSSAERIAELESEITDLKDQYNDITSFIDDQIIPAINSLRPQRVQAPAAAPTPQPQQDISDEDLRHLANLLGSRGR